MEFSVPVRYIPVSGINGINGSMHFLDIDGKKILLDAGMNPQNPNETREKIEKFDQEPDAVIISHAHFDHIGSLPFIIRKFPRARIYMTYPTLILGERMLEHSIHLSRKQAREKWEKWDYGCSMEELEQMFQIFQSFRYKRSFPIHHFFEKNIQISFWDAGHILGSAGILLQYQSKSIFYTGNMKLSSQSIMKGAELPGKQIEILFLESTYGSNESNLLPGYQEEKSRFVKFVNQKLQADGMVLVPVFALGRTQEILRTLYDALIEGNLRTAQIYVTGLGNSFIRLYDQLSRYWKKKGDIKLKVLCHSLKNIKSIPPKSIVLATSGFMKEGTYSFEIAKKIINDPKSGIAFVGYMDPDTPGYKLREQQIQSLNEESALLKGAEVQSFHFSAHSPQKELLEVVKKLQPRKIILHHGEYEAMNNLKDAILDQYSQVEEVLIPSEGSEYKL